MVWTGVRLPQPGVWQSAILLLELPPLSFPLLFGYSGSIHLDFPRSGFLCVSIIFRLLGGLVSDRQQRQLVLRETMRSRRKCGLSRCHHTHRKEVTAARGGEMYVLRPYG